MNKIVILENFIATKRVVGREEKAGEYRVGDSALGRKVIEILPVTFANTLGAAQAVLVE